jgi:hypothetical protein
MPRQPLSLVLPESKWTNLEMGQSSHGKRPKLEALISKCIMSWPYIEAEMTLTLGALLGVNNDVAFALFNSLRRSRGQRDAIVEAARASSLEPEELELITALLNVHRSIEAERTALAHGHFGIVAELTDGVIWMAANDYIHFQASMMLGPTAAIYNEEKHRRLVKTLFVYRDSDLNQMLADFSWLGQYWSDFIAYHSTKNDSEKRAALYRRLCGQSHIARELDKLRQKKPT